MQVPKETTSSTTLVHVGVYSAARMGADLRTQDIAPPVKNAALNIRAKQRALEDAEVTVIEALAVFDYRELSLENVMKAFSDGLYNASGRDRKAPRYCRIFPQGVLVYTLPRGEEQAEAGRSLLRHLANIPDEPLIAQYQPLIVEKLTELQTALDAHKSATNHAESLRSAEMLARRAFIGTYVAAYGAAIEALGTKKAADPFFKPLAAPRRSKKAKKSSGETTPAAAETAAKP